MRAKQHKSLGNVDQNLIGWRFYSTHDITHTTSTIFSDSLVQTENELIQLFDGVLHLLETPVTRAISGTLLLHECMHCIMPRKRRVTTRNSANKKQKCIKESCNVCGENCNGDCVRCAVGLCKCCANFNCANLSSKVLDTSRESDVPYLCTKCVCDSLKKFHQASLRGYDVLAAETAVENVPRFHQSGICLINAGPTRAIDKTAEMIMQKCGMPIDKIRPLMTTGRCMICIY